MVKRLLITLSSFLVPFAVLSSDLGRSLTQEAKPAQANEPKIIITKLLPPIYPPLARQTRISGTVVLKIAVRSDGSVELVDVVSGHPLLQDAALTSAKGTQFECQNCRETVTTNQMKYVFELSAEGDCCSEDAANGTAAQGLPFPRIVQSENAVTITHKAACICDPGISFKKVRSWKCAYLWRCGWSSKF